MAELSQVRNRGQASSSSKIPPQIIRHAILSDLPIADLKPEQSLSHDPLPPDDPIIEYTPKVETPLLF